jgi:hypothetical protein
MGSWLRKIFPAAAHKQSHPTAAAMISPARSKRRDDPPLALNLAPEVAPDRKLVGGVFQLPTEIDFVSIEDISSITARVRSDRRQVRRVWTGDQNAPADPPTAKEHAFLLLRYLQSQPFFAGHEVPARDLKDLYRRFSKSLGLRERSWQSVAMHLRLLTGGDRHYRRINGSNVRVYPIPLREVVSLVGHRLSP